MWLKIPVLACAPMSDLFELHEHYIPHSEKRHISNKKSNFLSQKINLFISAHGFEFIKITTLHWRKYSERN
jgi:hypothetical protein